jgi:competence protein ComEC
MDRVLWRDLGARPLLFPAVALGLGVALGGTTSGGAGGFLVLGACLAALALLLAPRTGSHLLVLGALLVAGAGLARLQASPDSPTFPGTREALLEGVVEDAQEGPFGVRVLLRVARWDGAEAATRVRLTARGALAPPLAPGQRVQVRARLRAPEPADNPGQPDGAARLRRQGVSHTGGFAAEALLRLSPAPPWHRWRTATQEALARRTRALAPSPEAAALFLTLAAGQRAALGEALEETFSTSGLAHVLSVSGLHVAALALVLLRLLRSGLVRVRPLARAWDVRRLAAPLSVPCVWAYVAFTGWQAPAVRSAVMATAVLAALALWRRADGLNALSLAALVLLAWEPASLADLSMQLSFLAVLALILLTPALRAALPPPRPPGELEGARRGLARAGEAALQTLCASLAVTLAGAPLVAAAFGRVSLAGLLSNVVCMPLCGLLTLLAAGGAALFVLLPPLATPLLLAGAWASELLLAAARLFAALPLAALPLPPPGPAATALFALGLALFALGGGRLRWAGLLAPAALAWPLLSPPLLERALPAPGLEVTFLSVGHGDAILLSSGGQHALVDGGGLPGGADPGERLVLPALRALGVQRLSLAVLSHPHPDHALGLATVLKAVPAARLWLAAGTTEGPLSRAVRAAAEEASPGVHTEAVEAGHAPFRLGEATLEVLGPPREREALGGVNDGSVVLRVRHGEVVLLLTGDVEAAAEAALAERLGPVTVLKAPHHGSRTSSTPALLARARPAAVVVSTGRHNRWGMPHAEVLARYAEVGARVLRTDLHGAVRLTSDGRTARLEGFLPGAEPVEVIAAGRWASQLGGP